MEAGNIVRYVGAQYPKLAGMEGQLEAVDGSSATVAWKYGHANMETRLSVWELKKIREYSKAFR